MKILSVPVDRVIYNVSEETLLALVTETIENVKSLTDLYEALDVGVDEYDQLDAIEASSNEVSGDKLDLYDSSALAPSPALNRRASSANYYLSELVPLLHKFSGPYIPLTTKESTDLRTVVSNALADLSYFVYYAFLIDRTDSSLKEGKELEISVPVKAYLDNSSTSAQELVDTLNEVRKQHRPNISILEAFPALEEEFYERVGVYVRDFETYSDLVTLDMVKGILDETLEVDKVVADLERMVKELEA